MNRLLLAIVLLFLLHGCAFGPDLSQQNIKAMADNMGIMENIYHEQETLISQNTKDYNRLSTNIDLANKITTDQERLYNSDVFSTSTRIDLFKGIVATNQVAASIEVSTAGYFAKIGDPEKAKKIYRHVITTYVGSAYRSEVKKAEFGLEDLKQSGKAKTAEW